MQPFHSSAERAGAMRSWIELDNHHGRIPLARALSLSWPPKDRPAIDETGGKVGNVGGGEVGFHNGASKPDTQLDPGFRKHPRLRHRRTAGSAVSRVYSLGNPAPSAEAERRRRCATMDVIYPLRRLGCPQGHHSRRRSIGA